MRLSRKTKFFTSITALLSIIFMQLAVAAYACPSADSKQLSALSKNTADVHQKMPGCKKMDMQQPALCHAHCQAENFSLDKPQLPQVQPFSAATLIEVDLPEVSHSLTAHPHVFLLERLSAPPLTIQNCCFRI